MKLLKPNDILGFGKNKGLTLAEIYKYQPSYIEWAIITLNNFKIDIDEFEKLPIPTTIGYVPENFSDRNIDIDMNSNIEDILSNIDLTNSHPISNVNFIKQLIEDGEETDNLTEFHFPEKVRIINNNKH